MHRFICYISLSLRKGKEKQTKKALFLLNYYISILSFLYIII